MKIPQTLRILEILDDCILSQLNFTEVVFIIILLLLLLI